jgi:hypothetical protein
MNYFFVRWFCHIRQALFLSLPRQILLSGTGYTTDELAVRLAQPLLKQTVDVA